VPVLSDECYVEFTWDAGDGRGPRPPAPGDRRGRTILEHGLDGVLAVHSLSKRSNLAGVRAGFYAGDPALVSYLGEVRKHAGLMVPGPVQAAAVVALADDAHVDAQRHTYWERLELGRDLLAELGVAADLPGGAFYLWAAAPAGDAWGLARRLADEVGAIVSPGEFYGPAGTDHVRVALVQPTARLIEMRRRLGRS
jgi:aspartate/methionine/tyrosine aminotransferase